MSQRNVETVIWTFRGKSVIRIESIRGRGEALEAAGLRDWLGLPLAPDPSEHECAGAGVRYGIATKRCLIAEGDATRVGRTTAMSNP